MHYKLPLIFDPQPEGGYTVTSPALPELVTEGDSIEDALENVLEVYRDLGRSLPSSLRVIES